MPRKLISTTGAVLALALAGCGGDDKKADTTAQNATTTPAVTTTTTPATSTTGKKSTKSGSKGSTTVSKSTDAQTTKTTKKSGSGSATSGKATKKTPKVTTTKTPSSPSGSGSSGPDLTSGTGSGPPAERQDVVSRLRRYYQAFLDRDGQTVCSLLTSDGQKTMIADGNGKNCEESVRKIIASASPDNLALLQRTHDGIHLDDITVRGNDATAQIGKTSQLKLVQVRGRWYVASPNVVVSKR